MNIEQLKMVIDLLQSVGLEGKELFIWWMALTKGIIVIFGLIWSVIAALAINRLLKFVPGHTQLDQLRDAAGVAGYFNSAELEKAKKVLREHYPR